MRHGLRVSSPRMVALYTITDSHTTISVLKSAICRSGESNLCRVEKVCELHNSGFVYIFFMNTGFVYMCDDKVVHTQVADLFQKEDKFDPLAIEQGKINKKALVVMVGAVMMSLLLNQNTFSVGSLVLRTYGTKSKILP